MPNLNNNELMISNYPQNEYESLKAKIKKAVEWSESNNRAIVTPVDSLSDLENQWIKFNEMIKKHRRESDWKYIELFGCTNQDMYEMIKSALLRGDTKDFLGAALQDLKSVDESYISADSYYDSGSINYTTADVERARVWAKESNRVIIVPTRNLSELEELWDAFNTMIKKHRRESDWTSLEIFGISNLHHYEYLKSQFLRDNIKDDANNIPLIETVVNQDVRKYFAEALNVSRDAITSLIEFSTSNNSLYENMIVSNVLSDILDKYDSDVIDPSCTIDNINYGDLPYLSPDEMENMGVFETDPSNNFYGVFADNSIISDEISVKEWFKMYKEADSGIYNNFSKHSSNWVNKVRELCHSLSRLKESGNTPAILAKKQSLLELGWDPDIEFSEKARILAREMTINRMKSTYSGNRYRFINLQECAAENTVMHENASNKLKPVYIALIEGKAPISKAIKTITKSQYSHIAISLDPELHNMYSYGIKINEHSGRAGFRREDIDDLSIGSRISVFTIFLGDKGYKKICNMIDSFKDNASRTSYSYINLLTYIFNIPYNMEWELVCSQFVDRCLKAADINLTGKDSSQVSPADLNRAMLNEKQIYKLYEGLHNKYNSKQIANIAAALSKKAKPMKESKIDYLDERAYISAIAGNINNINMLFEMESHADCISNPLIKRLITRMVFDPINTRPIGEAKEFPIQFDKEGNLLIKNLKKINYEAEYAKSHKLLKSYIPVKNYDGIKYELSKLWMMLCMIEDTLNAKKFKSPASDLSSLHKAKAKITNDFKYYLEALLKDEPSFNFTEYYDASPFSSAVTKINASTLDFMGKMIKKFIKSV